MATSNAKHLCCSQENCYSFVFTLLVSQIILSNNVHSSLVFRPLLQQALTLVFDVLQTHKHVRAAFKFHKKGTEMLSDFYGQNVLKELTSTLV